MPRRLILAALMVSGVALAPDAAANSSGPLQFSVFSPCAGDAANCTPRVLVQGRIEPDAGVRFAAFLKDPAAHAHELPDRPAVCFDSSGGSVSGALKLGA